MKAITFSHTERSCSFSGITQTLRLTTSLCLEILGSCGEGRDNISIPHVKKKKKTQLTLDTVLMPEMTLSAKYRLHSLKNTALCLWSSLTEVLGQVRAACLSLEKKEETQAILFVINYFFGGRLCLVIIVCNSKYYFWMSCLVCSS